jgi:membrane-anchored glycerophosphoryl diester phosphodiesterase (GDPDase)
MYSHTLSYLLLFSFIIVALIRQDFDFLIHHVSRNLKIQDSQLHKKSQTRSLPQSFPDLVQFLFLHYILVLLKIKVNGSLSIVFVNKLYDI